MSSANANVYGSIPSNYLSDLSILEHLPGVSESYGVYSGGRATLDRPQYSPDALAARAGPRYRNNNEECLSNNQCESNYCNMTISGTPAQNINIASNGVDTPNNPNVRVGRCTDVDNGLPSCLQQAIAHKINLSM